jgi:hypothetical protein
MSSSLAPVAIAASTAHECDACADSAAISAATLTNACVLASKPDAS